MTRKTPASTLKAHAKRIAAEAEAHDPTGLDPSDGSDPFADDVVASVGVATTLATVLIQDALSPRDAERIGQRNGLAMVVAVPGPDWVTPVAHALYGLGIWSEFLKRSGASRSADKPENGNDTVSRALAQGQNVCGVSQSPERYLPAALVAVADIRLDLPSPSNRAIAAVVRLVTGKRPARMPPAIAAGLGFDTIVACIRNGTRPGECVRRLKAASRALNRADPGLAEVPTLDAAVGYGADAMAWGRGIVAAVAEFKAGTRSWESIESRNAVFFGDAGTGKTTLARIVAKSTGLPLTVTSVSSWFGAGNGYLNDVIRRIDDVFATAAATHGILLLDEIDAIPNRDTVDNRHRDFWVTITSHILTLIDGAASSPASRLIIIGTTNFADRLDPALTRPGRLDRVVRIERPDIGDVAAILRQHLGRDLEGEDLMPLAAIGAGASGAEVAGWARQARMAARADKRAMRLADLIGQVAPPETRSPAELLRIARHEVSHALATLVLDVGEIVLTTVVAKGKFSGRTISRLRDGTNSGAEEIDNLIVVALAGRAADLHWGKLTTGSAGGSASDLAVATGLACSKVASLGLGGSLIYRGDQAEAVALLREPAFRAAVEADLQRLFEVATALVLRHAGTIERIARRLVERRILGGDEIRDLIDTAQAAVETASEVRIAGGRDA